MCTNLMDDLRDYRFYEKDMLHPNAVAKEYIWKKFMEVYFDESTSKFIAQWEEISAAMHHKAFQPKSEAHQKFLRNTLAKLEKLKSKVNVNKEVQQIKKQLTNQSK